MHIRKSEGPDQQLRLYATILYFDEIYLHLHLVNLEQRIGPSFWQGPW